MILKKCSFPIFIVTAVVAMIFFSCSNSERNAKQENPVLDKFLKKGENFFAVQKYDSAIFYFYKAKYICSSNEIDDLSYASYYIAEIQKIQCDFSGSEATATESLKINPNYKQNFSIYNTLGTNYLEQNDFKEAIKYYKLSYNEVNSKLKKCIVKNNIAYVYLESKQYSKAKAILETIVTHDSLIVSHEYYAKVLDNLGFAYFKLNQPQAIDFLNKSLKIRDSLQNDSESIASYIHLSEFYQNTNPSLAKDFAQKAYNAAAKINSPDDRIEALKFLINNSDTKEIRELSQRQMTINDSITNVRQKSKKYFSKIKYDFSLASKESEKQKSQKQLYLSLCIFILILFIVSYFAIRSRSKRKLLEATYDTETRISKKLHDELANDVFNVMTYADTQDLNNPTNKKLLLENLDKIYAQSRNISRENSQIDTSDNFELVLKDMLSTYNSTKIRVIIKNNTISTDWTKLKKESKIVIYRILQELMVNMRKYSHCSIVVIVFDIDNKGLVINYSDNGIGCPEMLKFKKGLQNAENSILAINGTITFETETNKGFKAKVRIPK